LPERADTRLFIIFNVSSSRDAERLVFEPIVSNPKQKFFVVQDVHP